ncbi:MAG: fibronectin type III domain-containing protein [Chlorobi bacterium OLB5]|nr:MAG: fibronectin type III domain-containing protein [Chlorobi bacterium OLB5]
MIKKIFPFLSLPIIAIILTGMLVLDPYSSRTPLSDNDAVNPPVSYSDEVKYSDDMNGVNDEAGLRSRNWIPKRGPLHGPIGSTFYFQGNATVFPAFEGPTTGYVGSNFNATTGSNTIDLWLISPTVNAAAGDTITFYERGPTGSTFPDSMRVHWASNGDTVPGSGSWVELGKFKNTITGTWQERRFVVPSAGATGRFAINYRVANGGPSGVNSDYVGVDLVRLVGPLTAIEPISSTVPDKYSLEQNYPNPFNPSTKIRFSIPSSGMVKMNVYDALGRKVESLVNETMNAGTYEATFNASKLSSGIYFYTIETGNFTATKKMLLVK